MLAGRRSAWMARPYSVDLRERVVTRVRAGEPVRRVAGTFGVSVSSVVKWSQRFRSTGTVAPGRMGGHRKPKIQGEHRDWLVERIERGGFTLRGLVAELAERGLKVDYRTMWGFVRREGLSFKKNRARRRARWKAAQGRLDPRRLVFIDETWAKTNMAPLRGWSKRGHRLKAKVPHGRWRTLTFLAALRHDRIDAPCVFDGPINGESFSAYVRSVLVPTLKPGDLVVLDNLGSHKGKAVRNAIRQTGARLAFLPPYSPDLNPIEQVFAKLKHLLREAQARTADATWRQIGTLLDRFPPAECAAYLQNAGYASA